MPPKKKYPVAPQPYRVGRSTLFGVPPASARRYGDSNRQPRVMSSTTTPRYADDRRQPVPQGRSTGASHHIMALQRDLNAKGAKLKVDGIMGPLTRAAQAKYGGGGGGSGGGAPAGGAGGGHAHGGEVSASGSVGASGGGGGGGSSSLPAYRQMSTDDILKNARSAMEMEVNPQANELQRQLDLLLNSYQNNSTQTIERGTRTDADLAELFSRLGDHMGHLKGQQQQSTGATQDKIANLYRQLQGDLGQTFNRSSGSAIKELERLGLGQASGLATEGMTRDKNFLQQLMGVNSANQQGNVLSQGNAFDQLMTSKQAGSAQEGVSRRSQSRINTDSVLNELMREFEGNRYSLQGKKSDLEATRGERLRQLAEQMGDKEYNRAMEQAQMQFQQEMARNQFALETRAFESAQAPPVMQEPSLSEKLDVAMKQMKLQEMQAQQVQQSADDKIMEALARARRRGNMIFRP